MADKYYRPLHCRFKHHDLFNIPSFWPSLCRSLQITNNSEKYFYQSEGKMIFRKAILGFSISIFLFSLATLAMASSIELRWHNNTEADLSGYNLYYGHQPRNYSPPIPLGLKTEYTLSGLEEGAVYYIAITAVDNAGNESGFSEEISATVPPSIVAPSGSHKLVASTRPDRSNAFPLEGLQLKGNAYIFLDTQKTDITTVTFFINGLESWTEKAAPYDLAGGKSATAFPFDTTQFQDGSHTITAKINLDNDSTQSISAPFYVTNNPESILPYKLAFSASPDRSNAVPLDGLQLKNNAYVFLDTQKTNIAKVTFFIDGLESWTEKGAPYDLAGGKSATAFPFNTAKLEDGSHTILAKINLDNGSTQSISAPFYVINNASGAATSSK